MLLSCLTSRSGPVGFFSMFHLPRSIRTVTITKAVDMSPLSLTNPAQEKLHSRPEKQVLSDEGLCCAMLHTVCVLIHNSATCPCLGAAAAVTAFWKAVHAAWLGKLTSDEVHAKCKVCQATYMRISPPSSPLRRDGQNLLACKTVMVRP